MDPLLGQLVWFDLDALEGLVGSGDPLGVDARIEAARAEHGRLVGLARSLVEVAEASGAVSGATGSPQQAARSLVDQAIDSWGS